ncbi:hypothetical protein C9J48_26985 [Photobacterium profundum]|nr:hypothetical protein C9J48_26985 [Photobacterium profundum]
MNLIRNKIKKIFKQLLPYSISMEELKFIDKNRTKWTNTNNDIGILIEGFVDSPTSVVEKARLAKAAEEVLKLKSIVMTRSLYNSSSNVKAVYESFCINKSLNYWQGYLNPLIIAKAINVTFHIFKNIKKGDDLVGFKLNDIIIGDLIYDTLIRFIPNTYTVDNIEFKKHFRLIFRAAFTFHMNDKILEKYNIQVVVTSHNVYAEYGLLCRQAHKNGALILLKDMDVYKCYDKNKNVNQHFLKISMQEFNKSLNDDTIYEKANDYYQSRLEGDIDQVDVKNAYKDKVIYRKDDLIQPQEQDNKNIFVMAHAFSDAPHVGEGLLFRDYYDWLVQTLIFLNKVDGINCFVKSHPSSYMWGEKGVVENIIDSYSLENVKVLPANLNTKSIYDLADCIVTAKGTAGLEFSCAGIPAIIAGKGYYSGFRVAIESESVDDYFINLSKTNSIHKLDDNTKRKARILLFKTFTNLYHSKVLPKVQIRPGDDYHLLYRSKYQELSENIDNGFEMKDEFYHMVKKELKNINEK